MNLDILNLEGKIGTEFVYNWVQQMESYYFLNQLLEAENITIASLNMSTSMHHWWENLSTNMEKDEDPIDTWEKFVDTSRRISTHPISLNNKIRGGNT